MKTFIWGMHNLNGYTTLSASEGEMFFAISENSVEKAREKAQEIASRESNIGGMIRAIIKEEPTILELGQYIILKGADY